MADWQNKIVGHGEEDPEQLLANDKNWRGHSKAQQDALVGVLSEVGWVAGIMVNRRTSEAWPVGDRNVETVVDGHARIAVAMRDGQKTVPVTYVDLTPAEENEVLATFDPVSAMAFADKEKLDALLQDVKSGDAMVQAMLADIAKKSKLYEDGAKTSDARNELAKISDEFDGAMMLKPDMLFTSKEPFGIPALRDDRLLELPDDLTLWAGDDLRKQVPDGHYLLCYLTSCRTLDFAKTILAFYTDDARFESVWARPDKMATRIINARLMGAVAPNYSLWPSWPMAMRIWNIYRSRWSARYFQEAGISIIPDINWSVSSDFDFCFSGIPIGAPCISIQVQTFDARKPDDVMRVKAGAKEALARLKPEAVLWYASKSGRALVDELMPKGRKVVLPTLMDYRREHLARKGGM